MIMSTDDQTYTEYVMTPVIGTADLLHTSMGETIMLSKKMVSISASALMIAAGVLCGVAAATGGPAKPLEGQAQYRPIQNISYDLGSKFVSGYFVEQSGFCLVTLMVIEWAGSDEPQQLTAARMRLSLHPGQIAGLDSEEGRSLNITCAKDATTLRVDFGAREMLIAQQNESLSTDFAKVR
jgi:hypothetical protein